VALNGEPSTLFLKNIVEELAADFDNVKTYKNNIPTLYTKCMDELRNAPEDVKPLLISTMLKNSGISSTIKEDATTQFPIFKDFLNEKSDSKIYSEVNELLDHAFDEKFKRIEVSTLIDVAKRSLSSNDSENPDILSKYINNDNFINSNRYTDVIGATIAFKELSTISEYNLTNNQQQGLDTIVEAISSVRKRNVDLDKELEEATKKYKKFFYSNDLDFEEQIHKMKEDENLDQSAGMISSHAISSPVKEVINEQKAKKNNKELEVELIEWERKYQDYLINLGNVKVMSSSEKFKKRFAAHGFAPKTSSLFGDSVVMMDTYGDPVKTLWNVSSLTGTMRLSRDVDYHNPDVCQQTFAIAALNARRQGWDSVHLNHPGPDREAKAFLEGSVKAMIEIGNYSFDDIAVPRKYQHIIDVLKSNYATIENGKDVLKESAPSNSVDSPVVDTSVNVPENKEKDSVEIPINDGKDNSVIDKGEPEPSNPRTVIPNDFDDAVLPFDINEPTEESEPVFDHEIEETVKADSSVITHEEVPLPKISDIENLTNDDKYFGIDNYDHGEIDLSIPDDLLEEHKASTANTSKVKPNLFRNKP